MSTVHKLILAPVQDDEHDQNHDSNEDWSPNTSRGPSPKGVRSVHPQEPARPALAALSGSSTALPLFSDSWRYGQSAVELPKPDNSGATIGIPIPMQPARRTSNANTTLPPMPSRAAPPMPAASQTVDVAAPTTPPPGGASAPAPQPPLHYRRVFVPSTVIHNGVAQQMLVPMMCVVAGNKPVLAPLRKSPLGDKVASPVQTPQGSRHSSPAPSGKGGRSKRNESHGPLRPAYTPLRHTSQQSRYGTRSAKLAPAAESDSAGVEGMAQPGSMDALNMLADAALQELC